MSPRNELEDWLTELPPLDGADEDPEPEEDGADELVPDERADSSLDDTVAEDLDVDEGIEIAEEAAPADEDDRWEADVGEPELDLSENEPSAADADSVDG